MPQVNLQRVGFLSVIPQLLQELGVKPEAVLADAGLDLDALDDGEGMIPYASMGLLIEACVRHARCPHFGLLLGRRAGTRSLGLIGQLMANAPDLGSAMRDLVAHQHRHARGSVAYFLDQGDSVVFGYAIYQSDMAGVMAINDGAAAIAFSLVSSTTQRLNTDALTVHLSRTEPADVYPYRQSFGCPIRFGSEFTGISLPKSWMGLTLDGSDRRERRSLETKVKSYLEAGSIGVVEELQRWLAVGLLTGETDRDAFASHLAMSRRTLNRRLDDAGTSFQSVLDDGRYQLSKQLLANTNLGIGQISVVLRYAEHSQFSRAFSRWSGLSPIDWRRRRLVEGQAVPA